MDRPDAPGIPRHADERTALLAFLDYSRSELLARAAGLSDDQLRTVVPPSTLSLARLLGHMVTVEYTWFRWRIAGEAPPEPFRSLDFDADPDAEMTWAETIGGDELRRHLTEAIDDSRRRVDRVASLDDTSARPDNRGDSFNVRWIVLHMLEEYARHCGHADLIREAVDGSTADVGLP